MRPLFLLILIASCTVAQAGRPSTRYGRNRQTNTYRNSVPLTDYALGINRYSPTSPTYGYGYRYFTPRYSPTYQWGYSFGRSFRRTYR